MALFPGKKSGYPTHIYCWLLRHISPQKQAGREESWKLREKLKKNVLERKSINIQKDVFEENKSNTRKF
jgi:hypothetical protein